MGKIFQIFGFVVGIGVLVIGVVALFMNLGGAAAGSFKLDGIIDISGGSTAIVFVLIGAFLIVASAGWLSEKSKKIAVARDLQKLMQDAGTKISAQSEAVLKELPNFESDVPAPVGGTRHQ